MIQLPESFPARAYVPHGYIDNPWHTSVLNRSGVIRSVEPIGFGFWCRRMPWAYGDGTRRQVNYLSFLHPSLVIDGAPFHLAEDFKAAGVELVSRYHTKHAMSYDWSHAGVQIRLLYWLVDEHTLACEISLRNTSDTSRQVTLHASNIYGYPEIRWWGSDGVASRRGSSGEAVAKIWAYGDVFVLRSDRASAYRATASREEWRELMKSDEMADGPGATSNRPDPVYSVLSSAIDLAAGGESTTLVTLTRGVNELWTCRAAEEAREKAYDVLNEHLAADEAFYASAPLLEGDWPEDWKCGWIYDLETIRMNVRPPVGIYRHPWDGMQIFSPRAVLGESVIDAMCLSYADPGLAKQVILGTFADAPMPNVPCSREDGSMNMISMGGEECGTAPIWVLPFSTIRALFDRDFDQAWVAELYPHIERFVEWWMEHRMDETGRFFCNNSWESGQDGSKRFLIEKGEEGKEAEFVQTVDVEAAMADAMGLLAYLAPFAGRPDRTEHWAELAQRRAEITRGMFHDGWFRDWDSRTGKPIVLPDYVDVMMLLPLSVGLATPEQVAAVKPKFAWFEENPKHWLEWPSFLFCYTEAGAEAGLRQEMAEVVGRTADRVYKRTNGKPVPVGEHPAEMPEPYNIRIPGTSNEYWPMEPATLAGCSAEAYGWGATLPTLILRNLIGFRENGDEFRLEPALPSSLREPGRSYGVKNLSFRGRRFDVWLTVQDNASLAVEVREQAHADQP